MVGTVALWVERFVGWLVVFMMSVHCDEFS